MSTDTSVLGLILEASIPVMLVMILLVMASLVSWSIIFSKRKLIRRTKDSSDEFEASFWSGGDLNTLYQRASRDKANMVGMGSIFEAGFREFNRAAQQPEISADKLIEECRRAMRVAQMREVDRLEQSLATLATIGSTSPYVGLFGTVWGIMTSFHQLANVNQATIAMVAPGISEALIATAMGLFAAIPAVIGFNRFSARVESLMTRYEAFSEELTSILYRAAHARPAGARAAGKQGYRL